MAFTWVFSGLFFALYIVLIFTMCLMTFQKGHTLLGILGIFIPFLWLIGAMLPAKPGSTYAVRESQRYQQQYNQMAN
jgi:hypothetical protein